MHHAGDEGRTRARPRCSFATKRYRLSALLCDWAAQSSRVGTFRSPTTATRVRACTAAVRSSLSSRRRNVGAARLSYLAQAPEASSLLLGRATALSPSFRFNSSSTDVKVSTFCVRACRPLGCWRLSCRSVQRGLSNRRSGACSLPRTPAAAFVLRISPDFLLAAARCRTTKHRQELQIQAQRAHRCVNVLHSTFALAPRDRRPT